MRLIAFLLLAFALVTVTIPLLFAFVATAEMLMPWLVFGFLAWVIVALNRPPRRRRWDRPRWQTRTAAPVPSANPYPEWRNWRPPAVPTPAPVPAAPARPQLPPAVQEQVAQIQHKAELLLADASRFPPFSKELYLVRQTAREYLPRTVEAYLALPPVDAERRLTPDGKTALDELQDQLHLLDAKLDDIASGLHDDHLDRLLANRQFLEDRFGRDH
jgi:hypothetical protein